MINYLVVLWHPGGPMTMTQTKAETYAEAVQSVFPGNDIMKIEVIALPPEERTE